MPSGSAPPRGDRATLARNGLFGRRAAPATTIELAETLYKTPALVSHSVRCGKPACRCATGQRHGPYWYLYWREGRRQRRRYVKRAELAAVRAVVERRRAADRAERLARLLALDDLREIDAWLRRLGTPP